MVEFETLDAERFEFGNSSFIEVARKVAVDEDERHEFVSIARGFETRDGTERWKTNLTVPDDEEIREQIADRLAEV